MCQTAHHWTIMYISMQCLFDHYLRIIHNGHLRVQIIQENQGRLLSALKRCHDLAVVLCSSRSDQITSLPATPG